MKENFPVIKSVDLPLVYELEMGDFINKLLKKNVNNRLGHDTIRKIKLHSWIKDMPWGKIKSRAYPSPCNVNVKNLLKIKCNIFLDIPS